jgi:hypothetical protein
MPDLKAIDLNNLGLVLTFIVPGLIIVFIRSQFVTGRSPSHAESILTYLTLSAIYYAIVLPFLDYGLPQRKWVWTILVFGGPAIFGLALGINVRKGYLHKFLRWLHFNPVHAMPTAWDWKFCDTPPIWVMVTLKNGTHFAGRLTSDSFVSSDPKERDIYIENVHDIADDGRWISPTRGKSVLITAGEISTIEFWPDQHGDINDQQDTADSESSQPGLPATAGTGAGEGISH